MASKKNPIEESLSELFWKDPEELANSKEDIQRIADELTKSLTRFNAQDTPIKPADFMKSSPKDSKGNKK